VFLVGKATDLGDLAAFLLTGRIDKVDCVVAGLRLSNVAFSLEDERWLCDTSIGVG
jgi:hypothetical protein